jgi:hypothetical protein
VENVIREPPIRVPPTWAVDVTAIEIFTNVKEHEQIGGTDAFLDLSNRIDVIVDLGGARYVPAARGIRVQRPTHSCE